MEVLDRYLQAVRHWLPGPQQDDIVAELSEDIRSEVEEQEAAAGRPLDETELAALLRRRGHPMWLAEGYLPQRHLIGPALLGVYLRVLKITLGCVAAIFAALYAIFAFAVDVPPRPELASPGFWLWYACLYAFAYVGFLTTLFALIERSQVRARAADAWDPRHPWDLPQVPLEPGVGESARLRVAGAGELLGASIFLLFWLGVWTFGPLPGLSLRLAPVWQMLHWPVVLAALGTIVLGAATLVRPRLTRPQAIGAFARDVVGLAVAVVLLWHAGALIEVAVPAAPAARVAELARWLNVSVTITVAVFGVSYLFAAVRDLRRALGKPGLRPRVLRLLAGG